MAILTLAVGLFFTHPAPLDMPRAEAYMVTDGETRSLEDRYSDIDLWTSRAVLSRWEDDDGRLFTLSRLDIVPPKAMTETSTRREYSANAAKADPKKDLDVRDQAIALLSPVEPAEEPERTRQRIRGFRDVLYYEGTNETAVVCAFLREGGDSWYLATWELAEGDERAWARELFEREILGKWDDAVAEVLVSEREDNEARPAAKARRKKRVDEEVDSPVRERELLRADARHSITNYAQWHATDAEEFTVLDNLPSEVKFVAALTNDLTRMRRRYAETVPSPINGSNVLCVARIYATREDYLAAAGEDMAWSAAYWNPLRRELVAHLPAGGADELLRTIRHEAFHQYLSYACCMLSASPWFNEGYAQYFEDEDSLDWKLPDVDSEKIELFAARIPALLGCDYAAFYAGDAASRMLNYRLAWSIAVFLEKGAPLVRFKPFATLKSDYVAALLKTRDMREATAAVFPDREKIDVFIREWKAFWKNK